MTELKNFPEDYYKKLFEEKVQEMYEIWLSIMFEAHRQLDGETVIELDKAINDFIAFVEPYKSFMKENELGQS